MGRKKVKIVESIYVICGNNSIVFPVDLMKQQITVPPKEMKKRIKILRKKIDRYEDIHPEVKMRHKIIKRMVENNEKIGGPFNDDKNIWGNFIYNQNVVTKDRTNSMKTDKTNIRKINNKCATNTLNALTQPNNNNDVVKNAASNDVIFPTIELSILDINQEIDDQIDNDTPEEKVLYVNESGENSYWNKKIGKNSLGDDEQSDTYLLPSLNELNILMPNDFLKF